MCVCVESLEKLIFYSKKGIKVKSLLKTVDYLESKKKKRQKTRD